MSFTSWLQRMFSPPSTGDPDLEDEISGFEWNQNVRIVLAILVVFISALVVWQLILHYLNVCKYLEIECFKCIICLPCHSNNLLNYF